MIRTAAVVAAAALVLVPSAAAALWVHATRGSVAPGEQLVLDGVTYGEPVYLVPVATVRSFSAPCTGCALFARRPPGPPSILLRRGPARGYAETRFAVRIPRDAAPGRYVVALYCPSCYRGPGGSLITDTRTVVVRR